MSPGDGERRPLDTDGARNPYEKVASTVTRQPTIPGLTRLQDAIIDRWYEDESEPLGGRPTGGVQQAIANADEWWQTKALQCIRDARALPDPWEPYSLQLAFGLASPDAPARWGALLVVAKSRGLVERVFYAPSKRPSANGRVVAWYRTVGCSSW